ncbi:ABC transporter permease [Lentisphaerota bacterium ZTH]|nr:ABC transporter permease [Lentisphaerota bacterium]WET05150.1 ABC transporter permease [Lentisphaerota bacterium ZTH]
MSLAEKKTRTTVIEPSRKLRFLNFKELNDYWELLLYLTIRDIKVKYKQTIFGLLWVVFQPILLMLIFSLVIASVPNIQQAITCPYKLFAFVGLIPWQLFAKIIESTSNCLVAEAGLVNKIYFPRILMPASACLSALFDFFIGCIILALMLLYYRQAPSWTIVFLPLFVILMTISAMGIGFWLSALNTEYRDVRCLVPFLMQFWFFASPVFYPSSIIPEQYRLIIALNPMSGVIEGIRWTLFSYGSAPGWEFYVSLSVSFVTFITGIYWFRWREKSFADHLGN